MTDHRHSVRLRPSLFPFLGNVNFELQPQVMKKILVPVDFSTSSHNASEYAMELGKALKADIHLLHVYAEPMPVGNVPDTGMIAADLQTENEINIRKEVETLVHKYGTAVNSDVVPGFKGDTIKDAASKLNADLIVMGVKSNRKNRILGSTTLKMIRKSDRPLLLIPEEARFRPLKHIVLAIDFTEMISSDGMQALFALVKQFDAAVSVLHVEQIGKEMKVEEVAEKLQMGRVLSGIDYQYEPIGANNVEEGILNFIDSHPADLLVMIAHHHSVLERLFNPIHTAAISTDVKLPLLVLKIQPLFG